MNKKLQVFVSSTYTDLIEERQAAVEAILDAGHIPAGMELFKAGNESQLKTIYKWIDQSDVYMLILGGRYGSVEAKTGKSYTQLEYEYALGKGIPVFAVVLDQDFLTEKINRLGLDNVMEHDHSESYYSFKELVMSKIIRKVNDCKDIKLAVHSTLNEFMNEYELYGWVRNTGENDNTQLLKENNALVRENASLNKQIQKLQEQLNVKAKEQFGKFSFDELLKTFKRKNFKIPAEIIDREDDLTIDALRFYVVWYDGFVTGVSNQQGENKEVLYIYYNIAPYYTSFALLEKVNLQGGTVQQIQITKTGAAFYAMLEVKGMIKHS